MPRRSKASDLLLGVVAMIGLAIGAVVKFFETVGFVIPLVSLAIALGVYALVKIQKQKVRAREREARRAALIEKYGDEQIVDNILGGRMWVGQTASQLVDSIGTPVDTDQKVLKTKKREVWKYGHKGGNRFAYRITLENDVVVGWDEKA